MTSTLTPLKAGSNDFRFTGYGAQHDGVFRAKYPAMNPWGVQKELSTDFFYQRPVVTTKIVNPLAEGFPGYLAQVAINDTLTGQPITTNIPFVAAPLAAGSGQVMNVAVGSTEAGGSLSYDLTLGKFTVSASRSPMGDISLWLNAPDAPNLKLSVSEPWDPSAQMSMVQNNAKGEYPVDVAPFDAQVVLKNGSDCSKVVLVNQQVLGTSAGNITTGQVLCGIRYTAMPSGIKPIALDNVRLGGYLHDEGENRVEYDVGILYKDPKTGITNFFQSGHKSLVSTGLPIEAAAPVLTFTPDGDLAALGSTLQNPLSFVGQNLFAARLKFEMPYPSFKLQIKEGNSAPQEQKLSTTQYVAVVSSNAAAVWDTDSVSYDVSYTQRPDKVWHYELPMTAVPRKPTISVDVIKDTLVSTSPVVLKGRVGQLKSGHFEYNRSTMGDWRVSAIQKVAVKNAGGTVIGSTTVPLAPDTQTEDTGNFALPAGRLPAGGQTVAVIATLYRDGVSTGRSVRGGDTVLAVNAGDPIDGTVIVQGGTSGKVSAVAPFKPIINLQVAKTRQKDVGSVSWAQSTDDGVSWSPVPDATKFGIRPALTQAGPYLYRATIVNKYDNSEFETNSVRVEGFVQPKITVSGANAGFVNMPITLQAASDTPNTKYSWRVHVAGGATILSTGTNDSFTFTPPTADRYAVELDASQDIAHTIESGDRTQHVSLPIAIIERSLPAPVVAGPKVVETGKPATFTVKQSSPFQAAQNSSAVIIGKWILPDGSTVSGFDPVTFVVQPDAKSVKFQSAVQGLEESTTKTTEFSLAPWTYRFPPMHVEAQVLDNKVPARVKYTILPNNARDLMNVGKEKFTYEWNLPPNSSVVTNGGNVVTVEVTAEGVYRLNASAADTRGNSQDMAAAFVNILPAPQLVATMKLTDPDPTHRAPDTLAARVTIVSMPKNDAVTNAEFFLDGAPVGSLSNLASVATVPVSSAGNHVITTRVYTKGGATTEVSEQFSLIDASAPVCQLVPSGNVTSTFTLKAVCSVDIGRISGVKWFFDDHATSITSLQANFTPSTLGTIQTVRLVATTDKGKEGSAQWVRP